MSDADAAQLFPQGRVLAGKYEVLRVLGEGGMGVVLLAHNMHLDGRVALKVPRLEILSNPSAAGRFEREAKVAFKLKSEHVARVFAVGRLETGQPFIEMEYLEGEDLAQRLERRGPLPQEQAVELLIQVCDALAEAHALGIVHRDLKPANLFCTRRRDGSLVVKVLDFGISKVERRGQTLHPSMTQGGVPMGSPLYMSPEQLKSARDVDARSDIWAVGVILYELLTGRPPFMADNLMGLGSLIVGASPTPLRELRPDVAEALAAVVHRCLEKDPAARFEHVAAVVEALTPFAPPAARYLGERIVLAAGRDVATASSARGVGASPLGAFDGAAVTRGAEQRPGATPENAADAEVPSNTLVAETSALVDALAHKPTLPASDAPSEAAGHAVANRALPAQARSDTLDALGSSALPKRRSRTTLALTGAGGAFVVVSLGTAFWRFGSKEPPLDGELNVRSSGTAVSAEETPIDVQASSMVANTVDVMASTVSAPTVTAAAPSATAREAPTALPQLAPVSPAPRPVAPAVKPVVPANSSPAARPRAVSCDPPYTVTPQGRKRFKPECF